MNTTGKPTSKNTEKEREDMKKVLRYETGQLAAPDGFFHPGRQKARKSRRP